MALHQCLTSLMILAARFQNHVKNNSRRVDSRLNEGVHILLAVCTNCYMEHSTVGTSQYEEKQNMVSLYYCIVSEILGNDIIVDNLIAIWLW